MTFKDPSEIVIPSLREVAREYWKKHAEEKKERLGEFA